MGRMQSFWTHASTIKALKSNKLGETEITTTLELGKRWMYFSSNADKSKKPKSLQPVFYLMEPAYDMKKLIAATFICLPV